MADIHHVFPVRDPATEIAPLITTPAGLDQWWSLTSSSRTGDVFTLGFGPGCDWRADVAARTPNERITYEFVDADDDWRGTRVSLSLTRRDDNTTLIAFDHTGWPHDNEHDRVSTFCWAMYLRVLRRVVEYGEQVPYDQRLDV